MSLVGLVIGFDWVNRKEAPPAPPSKNDPAILVEVLAGVMPTSPERIYALSLFPTPKENGGGGLVEYFSFDEKKADRIWPKGKSGFPLSAYRCQLTNYDAATLFGVQIDMHLDFQRSVRQENGSQSGEVLLSREWPIFITKIDPTPTNAFVFYVFNTTEHFVRVSFPEFAAAKQLHDETAKRVRLVRPFPGFESRHTRDAARCPRHSKRTNPHSTAAACAITAAAAAKSLIC